MGAGGNFFCVCYCSAQVLTLFNLPCKIDTLFSRKVRQFYNMSNSEMSFGPEAERISTQLHQIADEIDALQSSTRIRQVKSMIHRSAEDCREAGKFLRRAERVRFACSKPVVVITHVVNSEGNTVSSTYRMADLIEKTKASEEIVETMIREMTK